ncbi:MAG: SCO family protein [Opitutus sp.]|nr:SCO family protein [Opitutus sp.]MCS6246408.1 SCO family protein [Opitutus sp.]MCS6273266.1 SCO family protein [Opitutus sp.]MCS6277958.1 SCO family protein [Opitutus sp.]MCS6298935.1 SCO family protein [Opitutus sp.]
MNSRLLRPLLLIFISLGLVVTGCKPRVSSDQKAPSDAAASKEKRYPLTGEIIKADPARLTLLVKHDAIAGYMAAMTMEFAVTSGDVANAREGQRIRAELVEREDGEFALEKIWPVDAAAEARIGAATGSLRQDTAIRGRNAYREVGENLPDFALYDQTGQVVSPARFRGKQVMLNFIFTRCQVATMCPLATANMVTTQRKAREAGVTDIEFVSITLDPEYDTPGVLRTYAAQRGIDTTNFSFLTGPERAIKDLLTQFGVLAAFEGSILKHTVATLLIDPKGKIIWRADGSQWSPDEFVSKMGKR